MVVGEEEYVVGKATNIGIRGYQFVILQTRIESFPK